MGDHCLRFDHCFEKKSKRCKMGYCYFISKRLLGYVNVPSVPATMGATPSLDKLLFSFINREKNIHVQEQESLLLPVASDVASSLFISMNRHI